MVVAERCRQVVAGIDFVFDGVPHRVTASIGVASTVREDLTTDELLRLADEALYRAKADGRNCVRLAGAESTPRDPRVDLVTDECSVIQAAFGKPDRMRR